MGLNSEYDDLLSNIKSMNSDEVRKELSENGINPDDTPIELENYLRTRRRKPVLTSVAMSSPSGNVNYNRTSYTIPVIGGAFASLFLAIFSVNYIKNDPFEEYFHAFNEQDKYTMPYDDLNDAFQKLNSLTDKAINEYELHFKVNS